MAIPQLDLGESRTGFSASVTADGSDDSFNDVLAWGSSNVDPLLVETVEDSSIVSTTDSDSGTTLVDNGDDTYTYSGLFSFDSFPNVTMTFRDFSADPASDITITGWPPADDRAKDMHTVALDSRDAQTYAITIAWKISAAAEVVTPRAFVNQVNPRPGYPQSDLIVKVTPDNLDVANSIGVGTVISGSGLPEPGSANEVVVVYKHSGPTTISSGGIPVQHNTMVRLNQNIGSYSLVPDDPLTISGNAESTSLIDQTSAPYSYDATLDKYVRTDTYTFYKDAVNRTGELFAAVLGSYFNGS